MSTPPYLNLPRRARRVTFATVQGPLTGVRIDPEGQPRGTIVFVPGFTGSKEDFVAVLEPLASRGWVVVAYDQRGQFESVGPEEETAYSLKTLARDLLEVVAHLDVAPVHVVGHSFGGLVAREAALACDGKAMASLTLLCSGPGAMPSSHRDGLGALHAALPHVPLSTVYDVKEAADREGGWEPPSAAVERFMRHRFISNNPWAMRAKAGILLETPDRTQELAHLALNGFPIAVVYGPDDDAWTSADQISMATAFGTRALIVPSAGHSPAADQPEATAEVLDSLLGNSPTA